MTKAKQPSVLDQHGVKKLSDFEHARQRTEMYFGSRSCSEQNVLLFSKDGYTVKTEQWVPALLTAFREIIDNSLDEFKKAGTKDPVLRVSYNEETMSFVISDNGRGIPIDYVHDYNTNVCTMVLTETKTGRNFDDSQRDEVIGQNGLGGSITVIVSSKCSIEIHRTGKPNKTAKANEYEGHYKFTQEFEEGNILFPDLIIHDPKIQKVQSDKTGTTISFTLSDKVFDNRVLPTALVYSILKEIATANQNYKVYLNDERITVKGSTEKELFGTNKAITLVVDDAETKFHSTFYVIPDAVKDCPVNFHMQGLVNNAPALDGGSHLDAFKKNFALGILGALEKEAKKRKLKPNRSDIEEGLLIYNVTKMSAPNFASQIKTKLINNTVVKPINAAMTEEYYAEVVKKNKDWVNDIFERCSLRTNKKEDDENARLGKKLLKAKVANLRDAIGQDRMECILYCAEGNCLEENTPVLVCTEEDFIEKPIKDVVPGDMVLTHNNNIKPVLASSSKVLDTLKVSTEHEDIIMSNEHKMLIMRDNEFMFCAAKDIQCTDSLVRSKIPGSKVYAEIREIVPVLEGDEEFGTYQFRIMCDDLYFSSTADHKFTVYDTEELRFITVPCTELKAGLCILLK